jgi:hypothetical protein
MSSPPVCGRPLFFYRVGSVFQTVLRRALTGAVKGCHEVDVEAEAARASVLPCVLCQLHTTSRSLDGLPEAPEAPGRQRAQVRQAQGLARPQRGQRDPQCKLASVQPHQTPDRQERPGETGGRAARSSGGPAGIAASRPPPPRSSSAAVGRIIPAAAAASSSATIRRGMQRASAVACSVSHLSPRRPLFPSLPLSSFSLSVWPWR